MRIIEPLTPQPADYMKRFDAALEGDPSTFFRCHRLRPARERARVAWTKAGCLPLWDLLGLEMRGALEWRATRYVPRRLRVAFSLPAQCTPGLRVVGCRPLLSLALLQGGSHAPAR